MSLAKYRRKRNFTRTPEPSGIRRKKRAKKLRFVIQNHDATRLHYDFRLETRDGVLKSWAVPKGISLDPGVKRLAIPTEDHPGDYIDFEGVIPEGSYGAGPVIVWDTGTYDTEKDVKKQLEAGKVSFVLNGRKAKGLFALVRMKDSQWLLIKEKDEFASKEDLPEESVLTGKTIGEQPARGIPKEFPSSVRPMLAMPVDEPFDNRDWVFEVKWDGVRSILFLNRREKVLELRARSGIDITHRYPEISGAANSAVKCRESAVLDGEIVVLNRACAPDFQRHQKRMNVDRARDIALLSRDAPATYFVFDILYLDGRSLEGLDFIGRREILSKVIGSSMRIRISDYIEENGKAMFENVIKMNLEGIVAKHKRGKYLQATRSASWLKIKSVMTQDCVVIGYTRGEGNREGYFGSLILAAYYSGKLRFVGHSGSGFGFDQLKEAFEMMQKLKTDSCPIDHVPYVNREPVWLRPELVAEVKFNGWTQDVIMRAPIFVGFREDKPPAECLIESPKDTDNVVAKKRTPKAGFSNLGKVFWPATPDHDELKKADLIEYYYRISKFILPHLRDRPLSLSRYPDGILGKSFYHKNWSQAKPEQAKTIQVFSEARGDTINHVICNNSETLLWLANLGCIEMHPWYSRVHDFAACAGAAKAGDPAPLDEDRCGLATPDFIIFDLDPYIYSGKERRGQEPEYNVRGFKAAVDVAHDLKDLFDELRIESYVKTSGKTGLHVFVPVAPLYTYDQTRAFAEIVGRMLGRKRPGKITMEWSVSKRKGRVFFDHNQNARGKTIASIFSARPTRSATVSMPVRWSDLPGILPTDYTMINVPDILQSSGDPWRAILEKKQDINKILQGVSEAG